MEIHFTHSDRRYDNVFSALFLAAILCNVLAALDWLRLLPFALMGTVLPLIPQAKHRKVLWGILAAWLALRFPSILDGGKLLANRLFSLSEQTQSYEYDYFTTSAQSAVEAVLWLSMLAGSFRALWGNRFNAVLCGVWLTAMAYFGVTPGTLWLIVLLIGAILNALPRQQRWFHGLIAGILVGSIALAVTGIAPEPSRAVSALDERLRDVLAAAPVTYEQTPVPTEVPEPEIVPQPQTELEQPDHGVQRAVINILFFILAALTLALLFIPAIIKDRAAKRSEKARSGFDDPDCGAAIRAMYLYAQKWRKQKDPPGDIPVEIYAIWQEAAFSDHTMTEAQRDTVHAYMKETAETVWAQADWKKRLHIQYRVGL